MRKNSKIHPSPLYILSPGQMMVAGFGFLILLGAILLTTPWASASGRTTSFLDGLFTATSAICVTGLVVVDTSIHWSIFGKVIIIFLIQVGGLGFMTLGTLVALIFGKKINLRQRILIKEALNQEELSGSVKLIKKVLKYTLIIEGLGALILSFVFIPQFGIIDGIGYSIFTSISSFCNAGFDLMGSVSGEYSSIISYYNRPLIVFTVSALIILGGIGFPVIINVVSKKTFKKLSLNSKLALVTTAILIIGGFLMIFFGEIGHSMDGMNLWEKFQVAFFQSVTTRTAGYATIDLTKFRESTLFVMIILMFIGASPASTGGGVKTTTAAILFIAVKSFIKNENEITVQHKRINVFTFRKALGVFIIAITIAVLGVYLLSITQDPKYFNILSSAFEVSSALATVGLSLAGSNHLNSVGKIIIMALMFTGRVGSLTIFTAFISENKRKRVRYPEAKVLVG
nr:TrkH family potassium uptake protein [uncultured Peptostreptococcus sp.]